MGAFFVFELMKIFIRLNKSKPGMSDQQRIIAPQGSREEDRVDEQIRPRRLRDYIGQPIVREQMEIFIGAALGRGDALDHTLIFGPPGLGKMVMHWIIR